MSKILITGSSGFIGGHLVELLKIDHEVVPFDIKEGRDILDTKTLRKHIKGCDFVVHLAALASIANAWENPGLYYRNNVEGTSNVLEEAIKAGVKRFIFSSSCAVYQSILNPYAASKAMCEGVLQTRMREIPSIAFRFLNVYGKNQNPAYGNVMPAFIQGIPKGKITIYGDGNQRRDFIHVSDICQLIKLSIETRYDPRFPRFIQMDLGTGQSYSIKELAYILMGLMGKKAEIKYAPSRREMRTACADTKLMKEIYKYEPKVNLINGLERLIKEGL